MVTIRFNLYPLNKDACSVLINKLLVGCQACILRRDSGALRAPESR